MTNEEIADIIAGINEEDVREINLLLIQDPMAEFVLTGKPGTRSGDPDD